MNIVKGFYLVLTSLLLLFFALPNLSQAACIPPAKIVGEDTYEPTSIQDAYDYASATMGTDFTLLLSAEIFIENLSLDGGSVFLDGGYECSFSTKTSTTGILGTITVSGGAANFAGINIVSTDQCSFNNDNDGFFAGSCAPLPIDCNDNDPDVYPGAIEVCDGIDNNCDGQIDEGALPTDADGDGYYGTDSCGAAADDCNDQNPFIYPGAPEIAYDGIDQDCNGSDLTFPDASPCSSCHGVPLDQWAAVHASVPAPDGTCISCHAALVNNILSGHYGRTVKTADNNMAAGDKIVCVSCHDQVSAEHDLGANIVMPKVFSAWQNNNLTCYTCHAGHDHSGVSGTADCVICHNTGNPQILEIVSLHADSCTLCHDSTRQQVIDAINSGQAECIDCHAPHDHSGVSGTADCVICHNTGDPQVLEIVPLHANSCVLCHDSTRQQVIDAISSGQAECIDCHAGHDHNGITGTPDCTSCHTHSDPLIVEVIHTNSCALCHDSTRQEVINAISSGQAECIDCHVPHDHGGITGTADCVICHNTGDPQVLEIASLHANSCVLCHDSTRQQVIDAISSSQAECVDCHAPHDHGGITGTADCTGCHNTGDPQILEIVPLHANSCALCHDSTRQQVIDAINSGQAECVDCHTAHDGPTVHNNLGAPASCAACHTDKVTGTDFTYLINNHGPHPTLGHTELERCERCHISTVPEVVNTINTGKGTTGIPVTCENCHLSQHVPIVTPSKIHDYVLASTGSTCGNCHDLSYRTHSDMVATPGCAKCHDSANQDEYNALHQNDCLLCHLSPRAEVISAIYGGITGTQIRCINCHQNQHQ